MQPYLRVDSISCQYDTRAVVKDFDLIIEKGEIGCILGPSGCGKTSVLRTIAGFMRPTAGEIYLQDKLLSSSEFLVPPERRNLGLVYQEYALFPHLNVYQNICFGIYKQPKQAQQKIADELLELVQLSHKRNDMPSQLSGGQQQRVALARSFATNPDILLLDEPFSGLDVELRRELSLRVRDMLKERGTTALLVTHDQEEAFAVADRIGVMNEGRLQQWDTAFNLYHKPNNRFVADFVGRGSFLPGSIVDVNAIETEFGLIRGEGHAYNIGEKVELLLRPDDLIASESSSMRGEISNKLFVGSNTLYQLTMPSGTQLETILPSHHDHEVGDSLGVSIEAPHLVAFPATD